MHRAIAFCLMGTITCLWLGANVTAQPKQVGLLEKSTLTVTAASRPRAPLEYRLFPSPRELKEGNGAVLYYRAILELSQLPSTEMSQAALLLDTPATQRNANEVAKRLHPFQSALHETWLGARRRNAVWDLPLKDDGPATRLPEIQASRNLTRLLVLDAEMLTVEGKFSEAADALATNFALARDVGQSGTLISSLVGVACAQLGLDGVETWIQTPGSPNLYWSLTALPNPLLQLSSGLKAELAWLEASLPYLDILDTSVLSPQQGKHLESAFKAFLRDIGGSSGDGNLLLSGLSGYSRLKRDLIDQGWSKADVESMPVIQVMLLPQLRLYRELTDEILAWSDRPYRESAIAGKEIDQRLRELSHQPEGQIARLLLTSVMTSSAAFARLANRIELLRTVEAIRLFAASHEGRLPASLSDIEEVPIPLDPVTGREFSYRLEGMTGILGSSDDGPYVGSRRVYEVTLTNP